MTAPAGDGIGGPNTQGARMTESDRVKAAKLCLTMPSNFHEQVDAVEAALAVARADERAYIEGRVRALRERADAYDDAVCALAEVRGGPLSTTIGYLIRAGYLVPADPHRRCVRCGDAVQYLASDDLCDGCSATHTSTPLRSTR